MSATEATTTVTGLDRMSDAWSAGDTGVCDTAGIVDRDGNAPHRRFARRATEGQR
jgi:hypothetical protein